MNNMKDFAAEIECIEASFSPLPPIRVCVAPWALQRRGMLLSEWCQEKNNIYVGCDGTSLETLLGPYRCRVPEEKLKWVYRGSLLSYKQHVKRRMWKFIHELDGKNLGCYCRARVDSKGCPVSLLLQIWKRKNAQYCKRKP